MLKNIYLKPSYSWFAIIFISFFIIIFFFSFDIWKQNRITIDVPSYYTYLPSTFIYHDLKLNYIDQNPSFFSDKIWYYTIPNGNRLIKHSMGLSIALLPFFLIGHFLAYLCGFAQDGYSILYQNALSMGVLMYFITGLYFLKKVLLNYFSDKVVALTLISIAIGTNLLYYLTFEGLMTHGVSFSLLCICIYTFFYWLENPKNKYLVVFSIAFGVILLIRPLAISLLIYFLLYGIIKKGGIKNFFIFFKNNLKIIFSGSFIVFLFLMLQLSYWKYITGHWFFDAYIDEHFVFNQLEVLPFLLSFRKGWLVYTPIMFFAVFGFIPLFKMSKALFFATLISVLISIYIFSSWWAWSYGFCFGMRPMIDSYSFLSFPMAAFFNFIFSRKKIYSWCMLTIITLFISLNLFQTWQYKNGLIHFDYMTRKAYFKGFFQTQAGLDWYDLLSPFDWEQHKKGLPQIEYSKKYFEAISKNDLIYLRGYNLFFVSENEKRNGLITCSATELSNSDLFHLIYSGGDTISLQSNTGKYLSVKNNLNGAIVADEDAAGFYEKFIFKQIEDNDNRISLQTLSGKNVFVNPQEPYILYASSDQRTAHYKVFRMYVWEKEN
ncbi:MAG: hypothetical protein ABIT08_15590 [Bacteroidia bacterium]